MSRSRLKLNPGFVFGIGCLAAASAPSMWPDADWSIGAWVLSCVALSILVGTRRRCTGDDYD